MQYSLGTIGWFQNRKENAYYEGLAPCVNNKIIVATVGLLKVWDFPNLIL